MLLTNHLSATDLIKDGTLASFGFILPFSLSSAEAGLIVGLINVAVVALFRWRELRRRGHRDDELARLQARVDELEAAARAASDQ